LLENLPATAIHQPLTTKQYLDCTKGINAGLLQTIKRHKSTPPQVKFINQQIFDAIDKTHHRYFILTQLGKSFFSRDNYDYTLAYTIEEFCDGVEKALKTISTLMSEKTFAFGGRQYRYCWQLETILENIVYIGQDYKRYDSGYTDRLRLYDYIAPKFEEEWLPAYKYFDNTGWWLRTSHRYFNYDLSHQSTQQLVLGEIVRAFPDLHVNDAQELVRMLQRNNERKSDGES
ncbi:MAG: hypothetical protein AAFV93_18865, partial [Chloroflexota bacterium]